MVFVPFLACVLLPLAAAMNRRAILRGDKEFVDASSDDAVKKSYDGVEEHFFAQTLNHFDTNDHRVFSQRYFRKLLHGTNSIIVTFLCVGGEGPPLDASVLIDSVHCTGDMIETAEMVTSLYGYSVQLLALEHRYYGKSFPFNNSSDLSLLSSRYAVEDLAHFVTSISSGVSYIFGGSYPGMLAAFARTKYPFLFQGAVSNSAPVQAKLDFHKYNDHVGADKLAKLDLVSERGDSIHHRRQVKIVAYLFGVICLVFLPP